MQTGIFQLIYFVGFYILILLIGFLFYYLLWVRNTGIYFQINKEEEKIEKSMIQIFRIMFKNLFYLRSTFWINNCNFEGYAYLFFIRRMIFLMMFYLILSLLVSIPYSIALVPDWSHSFAMIDPRYTFYYQIYVLTIFSAIFWIFLYLFKRDIKRELSKVVNRKNKGEEGKIEWMKLRTIHIVGVDSLDRRGNNLEARLNEFLEGVKQGIFVCLFFVF